MPCFTGQHLPPWAQLITSLPIFTFSINLQNLRESRIFTSPYTLVRLFSVRSCVPCGTRIHRTLHWGSVLFVAQQQPHAGCALWAALPRVFVPAELTFLFCFLPYFRHPCTSLLLTRLQRDLRGNLCFLYSPLHPIPPPPSSQGSTVSKTVLLPALSLVHIASLCAICDDLQGLVFVFIGFCHWRQDALYLSLTNWARIN